MKIKSVFVCNECGTESVKWMGKCPGCSAWNTMYEEIVRPLSNRSQSEIGRASVPKKLNEIDTTVETRISTGMPELDRVLGGGIVTGSLVLVGGDPGIGKSTLLLQMCQRIDPQYSILYISGEESQRQIKLRADRLGITSPNLQILTETNMDDCFGIIEKNFPGVLIIDSVQTMYNPAVSSAPGNVSQIREVTVSLMRFAKDNNIPVFLVGHVTKEGSIAGPKVLEHIVDCVLYFEGDKQQAYRILRAVKNRFGSTNEIGIFEMSGGGLIEVANPSMALLTGRPESVPGTCVVCSMEGTRPILAEVQALVSKTNYANGRRMSAGIENNRAVLMTAVLEKQMGMQLSGFDVYINVVGGLQLCERSADLGVNLAIASSLRDIALPAGLVVIGEVGLTGEIRSCQNIEQRYREVEKLGFSQCVIPYDGKKHKGESDNFCIIPIKSIREAVITLL